MFNSDEMDKFLEKLNLPNLTQEKKRGKLNISIAIKFNLRGEKITLTKKLKTCRLHWSILLYIQSPKPYKFI